MRKFRTVSDYIIRYNYGLGLEPTAVFISASVLALVLEAFIPAVAAAEEVSSDEVSRVPSFMFTKPVPPPSPKPFPLPKADSFRSHLLRILLYTAV